MAQKITPQKRHLIYEAHERGMSSSEAAQYASVAKSTVLRYWVDRGLEPNHQISPPLTEEVREKVSSLYGENLSLGEVARRVGVSRSSVKRLWDKEGLKSPCRQTPKTSDEVLEKICAAHRAGFSVEETAHLVGVSGRTVRRYWEEAQLPPQRDYSFVSPEQQTQIYEAHTRMLSLAVVAESIGVSPETVRAYWKEAGLQPHGLHPGRKEINNSQERKILEAHEKGMSLAAAARYASCSRMTVKRRWDDRGLSPHYASQSALTADQSVAILEAHSLKMTVSQAAAHAGVSSTTVRRHWNAKGLIPYHKVSRKAEEK